MATADKQETAVQEDKPTVEIHLGPPMQEKASADGGNGGDSNGGGGGSAIRGKGGSRGNGGALQMGDMEVTERATDSVSGIFVIGNAGGKGGDGGTGGKGGISRQRQPRHWWSRG